MNKQAFLEETYNSAFEDELEKISQYYETNNYRNENNIPRKKPNYIRRGLALLGTGALIGGGTLLTRRLNRTTTGTINSAKNFAKTMIRE